MEELVVAVPGMWADHHVIAVRDILGQVDGIGAVSASALDLRVHLTYDPALTTPESIADRLLESGYPIGQTDEPASPPASKPAWATAGVRVTTTDPDDLSMSGDHRKY